jgi:hypothetical protein
MLYFANVSKLFTGMMLGRKQTLLGVDADQVDGVQVEREVEESFLH